MKCKQCNEVYAVQFHDDFVKGICLPCQVQARHDKWWTKVCKEILRYNHCKHTSYDFNSFCYDCSICKIKVGDLNDYDELKKICKREYEIWTEYLKRNQQLELF